MLDPSDIGWPERLAFFVALAFGGAVSALTVWPPKNKAIAVSNLFVGTLVSVATTPALMDALVYLVPNLPVSEGIRGAAYFWLGALGLKLIPIALSAVKLLKSIRIGGAPE